MRDRILQTIGISLFVVCFVISVVRVMSYHEQERDPNRITIRFAHWQLEGGVRDAFDALAREYEALHPGVTVEQMAIPERIAKNWARTQLVGGTAPDLVQIGGAMGTNTPEILARFFVPLSQWIDLPNPYNAGTELAEIPWRDTFIDGLGGQLSYSESLLETYGIPNSIFTIRMYYNRDLWREVTGSDAPPQSFEEFVAVCERAPEFMSDHGTPLIPIAGSKYNAPFVLDALFQNQTQRLRPTLSRMDKVNTSAAETALAFLEGRWSWDQPELRNGLDLIQRSGRFMQPGFLSVGREDALLYFAQGRALMIATGSWDGSSLRGQVPFEIGAFKIPLPAPAHPVYGEFTYGQSSEAGIETGLTFGITTESPNQEIALDFLRFMSSKKSNANFVKLSGWLPAVVGVEVSEHLRAFEPVIAGAVGGFPPSLYLGSDTGRLIENQLHQLVGTRPAQDGFLSAMERGYANALSSDLHRMLRQIVRTTSEKDAVIAAYWQLAETHPENPVPAVRASEILESQTRKESEHAYTTYRLKLLGRESAF